MTTRAPSHDQIDTLAQSAEARSRRLALTGALWSAGGLDETIGLRTVQAELLGLAQETTQAGLPGVSEVIAAAAETLGWCGQLQHTQPLQMGRRILVLDDNEVTSDLIAVALAGVGCVVSVAPTLAECIQRFVDFEPEMILLEPAHPDIEAMPSLEAFRKRLKSSFVPVILFSAETEAKLAQKAQILEADGYLTKDHGITEMVSKVEEILAEIVW